jgi:short subunit dehydrogenase-like uncharacterized protein
MRPLRPSRPGLAGKVCWQQGSAARVRHLGRLQTTAAAAAATAEVAQRLARGEGRPGAFTPAALFGPELALAAGGEFVIDPH